MPKPAGPQTDVKSAPLGGPKAGVLGGYQSPRDSLWYTAKRRLLGPPLVNEQLGEQRLSYREIVMVYIRPGGSYVVARENFGPRIAQICAVALLIDYVVTVAVQVAAGTAAVASAIPAIGPYKLEICVAVIVLMAYGNLR